ncbi:hypothetical protein N7530_007503 [Penicillium desertorum]|uniref:AA1-like domain-containing protein n=1 Tax=Penicillium desertorum TaxID=1303715 RepID=A0A9W9WMF0_9EURO|nr:hypothetical protein N7530_007503 [Penicillium desertorum]
MKVSALIAFAVSASAATIQSRQALNLGIGKFHADCIPHSTYCSYDFTVTSDPVLPESHCNAFIQGPDQLPSISEGSCRDNAAYTWSVTDKEDGGLDFAIWYPFNSRSNITYCHSIPASQINTENNGTVQTEHYKGPVNFTAAVFDCPSA